jgi:hypothetical protein
VLLPEKVSVPLPILLIAPVVAPATGLMLDTAGTL